MWRSMNPLALQTFLAAWRVQLAQRGSWIPNSIGTRGENLRKTCLSLLPVTWWCPTVSFSCLASGQLGWNPVKQRIVRLWQGRISVYISLHIWLVFFVSCFYTKYLRHITFRKSTSEFSVDSYKQVSLLPNLKRTPCLLIIAILAIHCFSLM